MDNNKRTHSSDSDVTTKKKIRFKLDDSPKEDDGDVEKDKVIGFLDLFYFILFYVN